MKCPVCEREGGSCNTLRPGWLKRQAEKARKDIAKWPAWMRREAGIQ